jgi:tRNA(Ile)-lysidine synthase
MISFEAQLAAALEKIPAKSEHRPAVYLAAVSGGADSTAMLAGLAVLRGEKGFTLHCVHVEHGIRPAEESRGDALAVKNLCEKLEVPSRVISIPPGKIAAYAGKGGPGIEAAARFFRYKAFRRESRRLNADWILTAHTRDDQIENILMRVLRGSGPAGLAPMPRTRGQILRPLLDLTRQDLLAYLSERGIPYRTDSTNADIAHLRNRLRLKLIPVLDEFFPSWRNSLLSMAETQALTANFLASEAQKRLPWELEAEKPGGQRSLRLREEDFLAAPLILREEAVFAGVDMLATRESQTPRRTAVRRAAEHGDAEDLGPVRFEKRKKIIYLTPKKPSLERGFSLLIKEAGLYTLKAGVLGKGFPALSFNAGKTAGFAGTFCARLPLVFRTHKKRDCIFKGGRRRRFSDILDTDAYSEYTGIITACDADGPVAFIGLPKEVCGIGENLLVVSRDNASLGSLDSSRKSGTCGYSFIEVKAVFGGKYV